MMMRRRRVLMASSTASKDRAAEACGVEAARHVGERVEGVGGEEEDARESQSEALSGVRASVVSVARSKAMVEAEQR
eukprot:2828357-Rhodomonas_salina.2